MATSTVPRSRLSRYSSILMVVLGIITILTVQILLGAILTAVGLAMYFLYRRIERRSRAAQAGGGRTTSNGTVP